MAVSARRLLQSEDDNPSSHLLRGPDRRGHACRDRDLLGLSGVLGDDATADRTAQILRPQLLARHRVVRGELISARDDQFRRTFFRAQDRRRGVAAGRFRPLRQPRRRQRPTGPVFVDPGATTLFAACESRPIGQHRRRSSCGAGRSDRAGRRSRCAATCSIPRSSAATTRSSRATT